MNRRTFLVGLSLAAISPAFGLTDDDLTGRIAVSNSYFIQMKRSTYQYALERLVKDTPTSITVGAVVFIRDEVWIKTTIRQDYIGRGKVPNICSPLLVHSADLIINAPMQRVEKNWNGSYDYSTEVAKVPQDLIKARVFAITPVQMLEEFKRQK